MGAVRYKIDAQGYFLKTINRFFYILEKFSFRLSGYYLFCNSFSYYGKFIQPAIRYGGFHIYHHVQYPA